MVSVGSVNLNKIARFVAAENIAFVYKTDCEGIVNGNKGFVVLCNGFFDASYRNGYGLLDFGDFVAYYKFLDAELTVGSVESYGCRSIFVDCGVDEIILGDSAGVEAGESADYVGIVGGGGCFAHGVHGPDGCSHVDAAQVDLGGEDVAEG